MVWGVTTAALIACSFGLMQLRAEGLSNADAFTDKPDSIVGQEVSAQYFPAGSGDPLVIISNQEQARQVGQAVAETRGVVPTSLGLPEGTKPAFEGKVLFEATMTAPADSEAAKQTVERVRDAVHAVPDADAQVGGGTAALLDMDKATTHDNILIIPLVLLVVLLILCALLRALIAPSCSSARWCCPSRRRWASARSPSAICSTTRASRRTSRCSSSCSWWRWASTTTSS